MSQKREFIQSSSSRVLPNNFIDKEVYRIAHSLNFVLKFFFSSKYLVENNQVYPKGNKFQLISFCFALFMSVLCIYRMITINMTDRSMKSSENDFMTLLSALYYMLDAFGFTMLFVLDIVHNHNNIFLILKIQNIHKSIDFSKSIQSFIAYNWISILTTIFSGIYVCASFIPSYTNSSISEIILDCFCDVMFITFAVNYVVAIRVIILLRKYLDAWIKDVVRVNSEQDNDDQCRQLLRTYRNILKAFNLYKNIYQLLTVNQVVIAFYRSIVFVYVAIFTYKRVAFSGSSVPLFNVVTSIMWLSKNVALVVIHSIYCEKFYITVEEAKTACIQLMKNSISSKSETYLCKNVLQTNRSFSKMSACGLFYVDATLTICLMGVITNYAIVLLQFSFL